MLEVEINGQLTKVPQCTCGKCIVRRLREKLNPSMPYHNIESIYTTDYPPKNPIKDPGFYNRSKHSGVGNFYKANLPGNYKSTMKKDYLPFEVDTEKVDKTKNPGVVPPFIGETSYGNDYPNWGSSNPIPAEKDHCPKIELPLRGKSNYNENYVPYPNNKMRKPLKRDGQLTKPFGKLNDETTYGNAYVPKELFPQESEKPNQYPPAFLGEEFPPDNFESTYKNDYINYDDGMCRLRKYLNARGMRYLVI